jgi:heavy metal sensor kinase
MFSSVRIRLTMWYTAAMAAILILLASVTYFIIRQNVGARADVQGVELANTFLSTVDAEMGDATKPNSLDEGVAAAISEHRFRDVVFAVFDTEGSLIGMSEWFPEDKRHSEWKRDALVDPLKSTLTASESVQSLHFAGHVYRVYIRHFSMAQQAATLVVLQSLFHQHEFLETLAGTFAVVIPITLLIAGIGGYLLARSSLSPVVAMSEQARCIGTENLDSRLSVRNADDELGHLALSFNELLDRLSTSFERQKRFVADASHELRTPVAILCGETEVALGKKGRTEQEYREALQILADESKRLKRIVEDLFTLARADAGQYPLSYADFYLDELAAECAKNVRTLAAAKQITLACEPGGEALISADEALLRRLVFNLLDNAIKYTPSGGSVSLRVEERGEVYHLSVADSGPGIPTNLQSRIFERFFRVDKARSRKEQDGGGGAGLGLSIGAWIASAHKGSLDLTSSTSEGSTFTAILPKRPLSS